MYCVCINKLNIFFLVLEWTLEYGRPLQMAEVLKAGLTNNQCWRAGSR